MWLYARDGDVAGAGDVDAGLRGGDNGAEAEVDEVEGPGAAGFAGLRGGGDVGGLLLGLGDEEGGCFGGAFEFEVAGFQGLVMLSVYQISSGPCPGA